MPSLFLMMMKGQLWDSKISNLIWPAGTPRNEWRSWGFSWDREKGTPNQAELCVSQALEKIVGRGSVGGWFPGFLSQEETTSGRERREGRQGKGQGRGEGGRRASFRTRGKGLQLGGKAGRSLFCLCGQELGPVNAPECAPGGQLPGEVTAGTCA